MSKENVIVSISGVHGVGKTTLITKICELTGYLASPKRVPNPFNDETLSLMFYVLSFACRDDEINRMEGLIFIDRDSARDILVDVWAHRELGYINSNSERCIVSACEDVLCPRRHIDYSFLLDDNPEEILKRIIKRPLPAGHLQKLEYNMDYIKLLIEGFRREFEDYGISQGEYKISINPTEYSIIPINFKGADELAFEIINKCRYLRILHK
ncbi:MAG: hypothetical protein QG657_822 [Acidobacteriota bacterium]|nr:hypothetical protein [Acidobacteriota bacterium]